MTSDLNLAGMRFPRSMLAGPANERLLEMLGVEIVNDRDAELEDYARAWLAMLPPIKTGNPDNVPSKGAVQRALKRLDEKRAA
jgi:hypothetical protein